MNDSNEPSGVGIALSGGGFRATLFHLGTLWRLNELGWLKKLTKVSSVSGGSITAGVLGHRWGDLRFNDDGVAENFRDAIAQPLQQFCALSVDIPAILKSTVSIVHSAGHFVAKAYDRHLFHGATLQDLPSEDKGPRFVLYGTSYQSGVSVRFSRLRIADYRVGALLSPELSLARTVAVSSALA